MFYMIIAIHFLSWRFDATDNHPPIKILFMGSDGDLYGLELSKMCLDMATPDIGIVGIEYDVLTENATINCVITKD